MSRAPNLTDTFARKVGEGMFGLLHWCEREKGLEWFEEGVKDKKYINERMVECVKELNDQGRFPKSMNFGWIMLARLLDLEQRKVSPLAKCESHNVSLSSPKGSMSLFGASLLSLFREAAKVNVYVHDLPDVFASDYRLNLTWKDALKLCKGVFTTKDDNGDYVTLAFSDIALNCWVWRRGDSLVSFTRFDPDNDDVDAPIDHVLRIDQDGSDSINLALLRWLYCIRFGKAAPKTVGFDERKRLKSKGDLSSAWLRLQSREYTFPKDMKPYRFGAKEEKGSWIVWRYGKDKLLINPVLPCVAVDQAG